MDQVGTETDQAGSRLRTAQSIRTGIQAFHERRNRKLPEWGVSFDIGCEHERFLQRGAFRTLTLISGSKSGDYVKRSSAIDAGTHSPFKNEVKLTAGGMVMALAILMLSMEYCSFQIFNNEVR
jgi:hypothetical protein